MDIVSKVTGNELLAAEFNQGTNELENAITSTGISLSSGDLFQLAKTIANMAAHGDFYTDSGIADAYILTATGSKQSPTAYVAGFRSRFIVGNTNTGVSTVNIATLGVKTIKRNDGSALGVGDLTTGEIAEIEYDGTDFLLAFQPIAGIIRQQVNVQDGAVATGTTLIPGTDDSIPQNTEGDEYMTLVITPTSATDKLKIDITFIFGQTAAVNLFTVALFQDSTADALAAAMSMESNTEVATMTFTHYMTSGTTSATTFKVRAGGTNANTTTFNGVASGRLMGGVMASSITITQIGV